MWLAFDLRQRLQFALGDEAPVRLDQHEAPVALDAIEVDGNRPQGYTLSADEC